MSSSSCTICTNSCCRGGWNCGIRQILNRRKIQLLKNVEEGDYLLFLDLSNLHLKSLPRDYFMGIENLVSLHINLSGNDFEELPWWTFQHLERCVKLELHNNVSLSRVYEGLWAIRRALRGSLNLSNCPCLDLLNLDRLLIESTLWTSVDLSRCGLRKLHPKAFSRMYRLDDLYLSNNRLRSFVLRCAKPQPKMWRLDLSNNPIKYVDASVEHLQLDSCGLNFLEGLFSPAIKQNVELLSLSNNHLTEITCSDMAGFDELITLGLSNNKIRRVEEGAFLQGCPALDDLYMDNNRLMEIPANFFVFRVISTLHLHNNDIFSIHPDAFDLTEARFVEITLRNNSHLALATPPSLNIPSLGEEGEEVFDMFEDLIDSKTSIVNYLEELFEAQRTLEMAKKESIFDTFNEELMMRVFEPVRMERFIETHGIESFMEVYA